MIAESSNSTSSHSHLANAAGDDVNSAHGAQYTLQPPVTISLSADDLAHSPQSQVSSCIVEVRWRGLPYFAVKPVSNFRINSFAEARFRSQSPSLLARNRTHTCERRSLGRKY